MTLRLHHHPLSSYCWKPLIALYENATPFEPVFVDLGDAKSRAAFEALWPLAKFPVLEDAERGETVGESSIIVEYLDAFYPGRIRHIPTDRDLSWRVRLWDRFHDNYLHAPMQEVVKDALRPKEFRNARSVDEARALIRRAYAILAREMEGKSWIVGDVFTLADCAAAPTLFYASLIVPFEEGQANLSRYLERLKSRPSFDRTLREAEPYFGNFPLDPKPRR